MNKTLKDMIRIYNTDGMKRTEIAATLGISVRTVYRYLAIIRKESKVSFKNYKNYKTEIDDILKLLGYTIREEIYTISKAKYIMSPDYVGWKTFCRELNEILYDYPCRMTFKHSRNILEEHFPDVDMKKSLEYFRKHNGCCDCEVLTNVKNSSDNVKD